MKRRILKSFLAATGALLLSASVQAVPNTISYTGELTAQNGLLYSGEVAVTARIFSQMSGGSALWTQDLGEVTVLNGVLQADLTHAGLNALTNSHDQLWLEFEVDGETLQPRQQLTAVPYALTAGNAEMLGGTAASGYVKASDLDALLSADALPTDGINTVSNGALKNAFADVAAGYSGGPVNIPDFNPPTPTASASVSFPTSETGDSYATDVTFYTTYNLSALSNVTVTLTPPASVGVAPIVLESGVRTPGTYNGVWTPGTSPAIGGLLGKKLTGTWLLTIQDTDDTLSGANAVGQIQSFTVTYDVVRSDHMVVNGRLDVSGPVFMGGNASVGGTLQAANAQVGSLQYSGDSFVATRAPRVVLIEADTPGAACPAGQGLQFSGQFTVTKAATVVINASSIFRGPGSSDINLQLNGNNIDRLYHNLGQTWAAATFNWAGPVPAGTHTVGVFTTSSGIGACDKYGGISVLIFE
jgi:subtilisin-like proprotein convertase family protein